MAARPGGDQPRTRSRDNKASNSRSQGEQQPRARSRDSRSGGDPGDERKKSRSGDRSGDERGKSKGSKKNNKANRSGDSLGVKSQKTVFEDRFDEDARGDRIDKLQSILDKHHVTIVSKDSLAVLEDYNFIAICDDSESMRMSAQPREERRLGEKPLTRWQELQQGVTLLVDIITCFRPEGLDVYFLNSGTVRSVKSSGDEKLQIVFQAGPTGNTPLTKRLKDVAHDYSSRSELPTVMFIFTDGEPDGGPRPFVKALGDLVSNSGAFKRTSQFRVQIMACSNEDDEIAWLNHMDHQSELIDVTDDYYNEKRRVMEIKGEDYTFTRSDWLVKAILGPVDKSVDGVNEGLLSGGFKGMMGMNGRKKSKDKGSDTLQRQKSTDDDDDGDDDDVDEVVPSGASRLAGCSHCGMQ